MMKSRQTITYSGNPECTAALGYDESLADPVQAVRGSFEEGETELRPGVRSSIFPHANIPIAMERLLTCPHSI
jgi:hypothetical protein